MNLQGLQEENDNGYNVLQGLQKENGNGYNILKQF